MENSQGERASQNASQLISNKRSMGNPDEEFYPYWAVVSTFFGSRRVWINSKEKELECYPHLEKAKEESS